MTPAAVPSEQLKGDSCSAHPEVSAVREMFMYVCSCCYTTRKALQQCTVNSVGQKQNMALRKATWQRGLSTNLSCVHKSPLLMPG